MILRVSGNLSIKNNSQSKVYEHLDAKKLNEHFSSLGPNLRSKIPIYDNIHFTDFLTGHHDCKLSEFSEVTTDIIESYIKSLASNKATSDLLPLKIIKSIIPIILPCITHIVNVSLSTGIMPDAAKIAQVTPILKGDGGDQFDFDNYRGISILTLISKCIEHCVNLQTPEYFQSNS